MLCRSVWQCVVQNCIVLRIEAERSIIQRQAHSKQTHTARLCYNHLVFPFKGTTTIELLNQLEDRQHHKKFCACRDTEDDSKSVTDRVMAGVAGGVCKFISHFELGNDAKNCQYLKDDCLVFRIYAEVPSYEPVLLQLMTI